MSEQLTEQQVQANNQVVEQLKRVPVLQTTVRMLENQASQQLSQIAELTVIADQQQQEISRLKVELAAKEQGEAEQDENSES